MKFKIKIEEKEYEIEISEKETGTEVKVGGQPFFFEEKKVSPKVLIPKKDFKKKEISAPISGEIKEIFVKEGDLVKRGQPLFLLSAMKMENEILAESDGKVVKIFVQKGQIVKGGQKLIEIQ
ncbi:biotin/lipoyl-binding protein [Candidatus Parcubacteria bacterium]|nr:biotin/lipoyl-binding protein [Candidatus Parcubacteria bacterium]